MLHLPFCTPAHTLLINYLETVQQGDLLPSSEGGYWYSYPMGLMYSNYWGHREGL